MIKFIEKKWDFMSDENIFDEWGANCIGALSNGEFIMYYHARKIHKDDECETCSIYSSLLALFNHEEEEVSYPWTAENDSLLLEWLNSRGDEESFCGEGCGIRDIQFLSVEQCK